MCQCLVGYDKFEKYVRYRQVFHNEFSKKLIQRRVKADNGHRNYTEVFLGGSLETYM
ncbi:hypothetical protein QG37_00226 [Candidozyma auris]|uniref:Uncharacterized protein n=1 Tax=Candidozyma auris TaxID=498019 RepID=A0A0L0P7W4_CANAR|nr:hypothetical protein QG37_00226 [[Candida] auris]